ncbi:unnamed protein product [Durusdinium trenchii]|uniref:Uncharacterized protein n=1 Tax=Durusdinium trenchii TaxID=1381693 RepID=A0ABP0LTU9_9DINO
MPVTSLAKTGTYLAIFITALTSILWVTLLMQPKGWALRISPYYTIDTGVWQVNVSRGAILKLVPGTKGRRVIEDHCLESFSRPKTNDKQSTWAQRVVSWRLGDMRSSGW